MRDRYLPLSGVLFAVLMVAGAAGFPMPPGGDVSPGSHPAWLAAHDDAVIAQSYLRGVAAVALLALVAGLAAALHRSEPRSALPGTVLVAGTLDAGLLLLAQAVGVGSALAARSGTSADVLMSLAPVQDSLLDLAALPGALLFAAVGLSGLRSGVLPRWLCHLSLIGVPVALADAGSYDGGPLASIGLLGLLFSIVWALLVGVRLCLNVPAEPAVGERRSELVDAGGRDGYRHLPKQG